MSQGVLRCSVQCLILLNLLCRQQVIKAQFRRCASAVPNTASESKFSFSTAKHLSTTSLAVLHDSGSAGIQTSCFCRAKQNS